jgi:FAD/FMN-containing dehydrogenase
MGADSILEAELVTPDGELIRVNERDYSDLFWAIRGGGGSTFGVIISVTVKAHPMPSVGIVNIDVSPRNHTSAKHWWRTIATVHREMADLQDVGYAGYYTITGPPMGFHNTIFVYNASSAGEARKAIRPLENALNNANSSVVAEISQLWTETWYELIQKLGPLADASGVGTKRSVRASRLVTRRAIEDTDLFARTLEEIGPRFSAPKV